MLNLTRGGEYNMLRFLDAGESHGRALIAIIEGVPSNFKLDMDVINNELARRQQGYGRGSRMKIEKDNVELWSGTRGNITTGNPITMVVFNKDYENWKNIMLKEPSEEERIGIVRPGHGDLVGFFKYGTKDIRNTIERTSARETAIRTAVGALCKDMLMKLGIEIRSKVSSIGNIHDEEVDIFIDEVYDKIEKSEIRCYNEKVEKSIKSEIDKCSEIGDTVGGSISVSIKGVPMGIGSFTQWDRKLDGLLSYAIMSVQGIKAIEFGNSLDLDRRGSSFNDEIFYHEGKILRHTNNAGGIEAGITNGENINIKAFMKPIPTIRKPIHSIDVINKTNVINRYERSDVCGVVPASIVLENVCAFEILKEILNTFPSDDFNKLKQYLDKYKTEQ